MQNLLCGRFLMVLYGHDFGGVDVLLCNKDLWGKEEMTPSQRLDKEREGLYKFGFREEKKPKIVPKLWGYETQVITNRVYVGPDGWQGYTQKILTVLPNGNACSIHYHRKKEETFHILRGSLRLIIWKFKNTRDGDVYENLRKMLDTTLHIGDTITIAAYSPHQFFVQGAQCADFLECSTPDDPEDSYRVMSSGPLNTFPHLH